MVCSIGNAIYDEAKRCRFGHELVELPVSRAFSERQLARSVVGLDGKIKSLPRGSVCCGHSNHQEADHRPFNRMHDPQLSVEQVSKWEEAEVNEDEAHAQLSDRSFCQRSKFQRNLAQCFPRHAAANSAAIKFGHAFFCDTHVVQIHALSALSFKSGINCATGRCVIGDKQWFELEFCILGQH